MRDEVHTHTPATPQRWIGAIAIFTAEPAPHAGGRLSGENWHAADPSLSGEE